MLTPNEPTRMNVDMWHSAITFERGHRIAVHIASTNYPRFEINPNTGEAPGESTLEPSGRPGEIRLVGHQRRSPQCPGEPDELVPLGTFFLGDDGCQPFEVFPRLERKEIHGPE